MFGGLHIEMTCYKTLGDILRGRDGHFVLLKPILQHQERQILFMYVQMYLGLDRRIRQLHVFCLKVVNLRLWKLNSEYMIMS